MKLLTKLTLTAVTAVLNRLDNKAKHYEEYRSRKRTQQPLEAPKPSNPSKCICNDIEAHLDDSVAFKHCTIHNRSYINNKYVKYVDTKPPARPFLTSTHKSKYTLEELQAFYKINPYTNYPFHISLINT